MLDNGFSLQSEMGNSNGMSFKYTVAFGIVWLYILLLTILMVNEALLEGLVVVNHSHSVILIFSFISVYVLTILKFTPWGDFKNPPVPRILLWL